jgi:rRNA biogenesis protein RRP5
LDLEIKQGDKDIVRGLFERVVKIKGLKPSEWEAENGDEKSREKVKAKAEEWVRVAAAKKTGADED